MDRRSTLVSLVWLSIAPLSSLAQQQRKVWRIGYLASSAHSVSDSPSLRAFQQGMRDLDYIEGKNLVIESRFAGGELERLPALAAELVELKMNVIVADASPAIRAAQKATTTIPIVMGSTGDPVGSGFVKSLARPGGNITGLALMSSDASPKMLDLLREIVPHLSRVAVLVSPTSSTYRAILDSVHVAAKNVGIDVVSIEAQSPLEIDSGFAVIERAKAEALIFGVTPFFIQRRADGMVR